ncbi:FAD-dependent oxidoreductase [Pseudohongiella nitratireducens]|uniref:FAD-dependent oxidoreductase n=1 Tax=Pseudohongiella nitratireducens TaxID=1768907 RepID=UPI0030EDCB55|tara:strand:- start:716 stop:2866 length:2151 start_codon:yes stop_codon:yes gene_type:complete
MRKIGLMLLIFLVVAVFFALDLRSYLTLQGMQDALGEFSRWRDTSPYLVSGIFFVIYVAVTSLSLPGAAILTLAAGALFGLGWGLVLVSFASSIGATLAFLVSRFILRDTVQQRFGGRLKTINAGVEREGAFYLFALRLVPLFPFFLINLLMGLTPLKTRTFYWVSQLGMLPGTAVYINAGTQLGSLESLSGIMSPSLLLSFALLGTFPLIAKKLLAVINRRRVYAGFKKPRQYDRNLVVIGAGSGGLVASYIAATVKAKVTLVEANKMGGDCLNYGCVPSKALIKSAKVAHQMYNAERFGLQGNTPTFDFKKLTGRIEQVIKEIEPHDSVERYTGLGVDVVQGYARLVDPWTVEIDRADGEKQRLTSRAIVLATGASPVVPPLPGLEETGYVTSDTLWEALSALQELPERIVVLGGGPIGCELSQSFARLGAKVTQVEMSDRLMGREDDDVSSFVASSLTSDGVTVLVEHKAVRCEQVDDKKQIIVEQGGVEAALEYDMLICAVGRKARLKGYGLESLGIDTDKPLQTNEFLETRFPNIYACGDLIGPYQFTHVASHQAWYASVNAMFGQFKKFKADYRVIPRTTFTDPEVSRVGLSEREAKEQEIAYEITCYGIDDLDRAITETAAHGFVKVLTSPGKDNILGVIIVGEHSAETMSEFVLAMKHGLGLNKLLGTIHTYPTWAEANKYAAGEWKRNHAPEKLLSLVEKFHAWRRK